MNSRDTKLYPVCDPYSGEVGAAWERIFEPAFLSGISSRSDEYANLKEHLQGIDCGNVKPPTAAQLAANPAHTGTFLQHAGRGAEIRRSMRAFNQRSTDTIALLRQHCPVVSIQNAIDEMLRKHLVWLWKRVM